MNIAVVPFKKGNGDPSRLFLVSLTPKETLKILESPGGSCFTEHKTQTQFCIWKKDFIEEENIVFEYGDGCYNFLSKGGFKSDEEHLFWFISLGEIPIGQYTKILGKVKFVIMGYVKFVDERDLLPESPSTNKPSEEYFLRKMMRLEMVH